MTPTPTKPVLVYRSTYGLVSETFVRDHVHSLKRFKPLVLTNRLDPQGAGQTGVVTIPNQGRITRRLWDAGLTPSMHRLFKTHHPALIHAHFLTDGAAILPFARKYGIPLVVTAHGYDATLYPKYMAQSVDGARLLKRRDALASYAVRIICVSDFIRDELIKQGWPSDQLVTQLLGVDTTTICPPKNGERRGIITAGRLVEKKGTQYLIKAYARLPLDLQDRHPLTVIGGGPLRTELEALARNLGVSVDFQGQQPREAILSAVGKSAVFCFPSIRATTGDAEGMGIVVMEALARATPVVLFDEQPAASIVAQAGAGTLAPSRDIDALTKALFDLLSNEHTLARFSIAARRLACEKFNIITNASQVEDIYESLGE